MCPVAQQPKRSQPAGVGAAPRHDRDIAPEVGGDLGGEQRAGSFSRLDDHDDAGERGDDPLGGKEAPAPGRGEPGRELRDRGTMQKDAVVQVVELAGVGDLGCAAGNCDRASAGVQRAVVGDPVDSLVQPADDRHSGCGEVAGERERHLVRVPAMRPFPEEGDYGCGEQFAQPLGLAGRVEHRGRGGQLREGRRVAGVVAADRARHPTGGRVAGAGAAGRVDLAQNRVEVLDPGADVLGSLAEVLDPDSAAEPLVGEREQLQQRLAREWLQALDRGCERGDQRGATAAVNAGRRAQLPGGRARNWTASAMISATCRGAPSGPVTRREDRRPEIATPLPLERPRWLVRA